MNSTRLHSEVPFLLNLEPSFLIKLAQLAGIPAQSSNRAATSVPVPDPDGLQPLHSVLRRKGRSRLPMIGSHPRQDHRLDVDDRHLLLINPGVRGGDHFVQRV